MSKDIIFKILKSLFITLCVSLTAGLFFNSFGFPFLNSFLFFTFIQFIAFYFYGEYVKRKTTTFLSEFELKQQEIKSRQQATVVCPCDRGVETTIPINVNGDNTYKCPGCMKNVTVFVATKTALSTEPANNVTI